MNHQSRKEVPPGPIVPQGTFAAALTRIPDPRHPFGWRPDHPPLPLVSLLLLTLAALLAGATTVSAIAQWGRERLADQPDLLLRLGFPAGQSPAVSTLHRVYRHLDHLAVEQTITDWLMAQGLPVPEHLTVDGQTLHALAAGAVPASHLVSLFAPATRQVLAQVLVPNKGHEQAALTTLRSRVRLAGHTVSFDALHTHRAVCQAFEEAGATCVAPVRGNQPTLERELQNLFADWPLDEGDPPPWLQAEIQAAGGRWAEHVQITTKPQHGRPEWRRVCTWTDPRWPAVLGIAGEEGQPGTMVRQIVRVERRRLRLRQRQVIKVEQEVRYFVVNHPQPVAIVARVIRGHWGIENLLHRQRDMLFEQDRCTVRSGTAPILLADLRNLVLTLLARALVPNAAAFRRTLAARPSAAVDFVLRL